MNKGIDITPQKNKSFEEFVGECEKCGFLNIVNNNIHPDSIPSYCANCASEVFYYRDNDALNNIRELQNLKEIASTITQDRILEYFKK